METTALREKLHSLIDNSPQEKLIEVYSFFEDSYSDDFKDVLDEEYADYLKDGKTISKEDLNKAIDKLLYEK